MTRARRAATARMGAVLAAALLALAASLAHAQGIADFEVRDGGIHEPLTGARGDPARGRRIAIDPSRGNCLICHTVPDAPQERFQGDIGPPLAGVGARVPEPRLRLRVVDGTRIAPDTVMPAYHRVDGLQRVAPEWKGRPVLDAAEVEDVVAWLLTLDGAR